MSVSAKKAYNDIIEQINEQGKEISDWYCGVAEDIDKKLHDEHNVPKENHSYIVKECTDSYSARKAEKALLDIGCDGHIEGGETNATQVYAYLKTNVTSP